LRRKKWIFQNLRISRVQIIKLNIFIFYVWTPDLIENYIWMSD
jgi:hypothetical protein